MPDTENETDDGTDDQSAVLAFLRDPATHGGTAPREIVTHSARVFLGPERALKLKRAVRYDYLDFATAENRRATLDRELALNRPAAPEIYDRVAPITRAEGGRLALDGAGPAVDHVLVMRRFPDGSELAHVAAAGRLDRALAETLGRTLAAYYARAPRVDADGAVLMDEIVAELDRVFATLHGPLGRDRCDRLTAALRARAAPDLRARADRIRRGHGDLHMENVLVLDGAPVLFDALEFDERLGTCDTAYDAAFLWMDMVHRGYRAAANATFNAYLDATGDTGLVGPLPLFLAVRAAIRAMAEAQRLGPEARPDRAGAAGAYLDAALGFLAPPPATMVAVGGVSGTGKTRLARDLAPGLGPAPGAVHLRSDVIRKALFGVAPTDPLGPEGYTREATQATYDRMAAQARDVAGRGHAALLDATFLDGDAAADCAAAAAAAGVRFAGLWLTGDPDTLAARVAARRDDASDADVAVLRRQLDHAAAPAGWSVVDAGGPPEATLDAAHKALDLD